MNKQDLMLLSKVRIKEARVLLSAEHFSGAYYLAGYSVECAIKACIAGQIRSSVVPEKNFGQQFYQHNLENLVRYAGLWAPLQAAISANRALSVNWVLVKDWSEQSRYFHDTSKAQADDLLAAITARKTGILSWVKSCM